MVPRKLIFALCCSVGVTLPFAVMAQMTPQAPGGMTPSTPSQTMPPASGGVMRHDSFFSRWDDVSCFRWNVKATS